MKQIVLALALSLTLAPTAPAIAAETAAAPQSSLPWVNAQVKKIDTSRGRITLRHDDIPNLDMPGMTMIFNVADPALLEQVKPGDAVRVAIDKVNGKITVIRMEPKQ